MTDTIVVFEDDYALVDLLREVLADAGYRVVTDTSVAHALPLVLRERPALIILDFWIGGQPAGLHVLQQLRDRPKTASIPVLLCSADRDALYDYAQDWRALGCDILLKPFTLDTLLERVQQVMPRHVSPPSLPRGDGHHPH
jgi:DNA-binding response OmpR family regulator